MGAAQQPGGRWCCPQLPSKCKFLFYICSFCSFLNISTCYTGKWLETKKEMTSPTNMISSELVYRWCNNNTFSKTGIRFLKIVNLCFQGIARRLIKLALHVAARKREMRYSDLQNIDRGVRRHFHDDITVIVVFLDPPTINARNICFIRAGGVTTPTKF